MNEPSMRQHISRAMDEIYTLRAICADEARRIRSEEIPKARSAKRWKELLERVDRLERAACGDAEGAWPKNVRAQLVLQLAGASGFLNFETWKNEHEHPQPES